MSSSPRALVGALLIFALAGVGVVFGLRGWSGTVEKRWAKWDARLPVGTPRALILQVLGPGSNDPEPWTYVIETRGDCGSPPDGLAAFVSIQHEQGRSLLGYRSEFPVTRLYLYVLDPEDRLICRVIAGS